MTKPMNEELAPCGRCGDEVHYLDLAGWGDLRVCPDCYAEVVDEKCVYHKVKGDFFSLAYLPPLDHVAPHMVLTPDGFGIAPAPDDKGYRYYHTYWNGSQWEPAEIETPDGVLHRFVRVE